MSRENKYDGIIAEQAKLEQFPFSPAVIKAIINIGSDFNPDAKGPTRALGLCQFTEPAWSDVMDELDFDLASDPELAITACTRYIKQIDSWVQRYIDQHKIEMPNIARLCCIVASYDCGRGYVRKAIELSFTHGEIGNQLVTWDQVKYNLQSDLCQVRGEKPHASWVLEYVKKFLAAFRKYLAEEIDSIPAYERQSNRFVDPKEIKD